MAFALKFRSLPLRQLRVIMMPTLLVVAGCAQFPDLQQTVSEDALNSRFPALVPVEVLQADAPEQQIFDTTATELDARIAALRGRAARLRGTVLSSSSRARLEQRPNIPAES